MLEEVFSDNTMSYAYVLDWNKWFSEGWQLTEYNVGLGRTVTARNERKVQKTNEIMRNNEHLRIWIVSENLTQVKNDKRNNIYSGIMERQTVDQPDLLINVITSDETWIIQFNPETKCQSMHIFDNKKNCKWLKRMNTR